MSFLRRKNLTATTYIGAVVAQEEDAVLLRVQLLCRGGGIGVRLDILAPLLLVVPHLQEARLVGRIQQLEHQTAGLGRGLKLEATAER
jgi:hypothetical protein